MFNGQWSRIRFAIDVKSSREIGQAMAEMETGPSSGSCVYLIWKALRVPSIDPRSAATGYQQS